MLPKIRLNGKIINLLLSRRINWETEYSEYPDETDQYIYSSDEIREICRYINHELKSGKGFVIFSNDDSYIESNHDIRVVYWNLFTCFASPLAQFRNGQKLFEVSKAKEQPPPRCSFSMTDKVADLHTDGSYMYEYPPNYIALVCLNQAQVGGESLLVDGRKILRQLKSDYPQSLKYLKQDYQFNTDNQLDDIITLTKPIIFEDDQNIIFNYNRIHIESGHRVSNSLLSCESIESMNGLDLLLRSNESQVTYRMNRGEMLLINNHIIFHGRKAFRDNDNENKNKNRLIIRLWGKQRTKDN